MMPASSPPPHDSGFTERRRYARYKPATSEVVFFATGSGESRGVVLNLGEGGMAVHTEGPVEAWSMKHLRWELPQQAGFIETEGTVVWANQENGNFGIMFQNLSKEVEERIRGWAKQCALANSASLAFPTPDAPTAEFLAISPGAPGPNADAPAESYAPTLSFPLPESQLAALAEQVRESMQAQGLAIAVREGFEIVCRASSGLAPELGVRLQSNLGLSGECVRTCQPVCCDDTRQDARVDSAACRELNLGSVAIVPILREGTVIGLLESLWSYPRAIDGKDVRALEAAAISAAALLCGEATSTKSDRQAQDQDEPAGAKITEGTAAAAKVERAEVETIALKQGKRDGHPWALVVAAIVALITLVFLGAHFKSGGRANNADGTPFASGVRGEPMLRLAGSNTIGAKLAPALAQEFLKQLGARDIRILPGTKEDEEAVQGVLPGGGEPVFIQIAAHGSATAFESLANHSCDIGMASRKVKPEEIGKLSSLGDMSSSASEHVLGLDGIAVIVSSSNPVQTLTKDQLAGMFSGTIADWSQVSSKHGIINVYSRDDKSGTYDTFKTLVLGNQNLVGTAKRFEDSRALSDAVAGDPNGVGFIGLPYVLSAKAVAVAELGATAFLPNRLTVGTEDYPLSRRLYLYTPASPQNKYVRRFVEFALSRAGQEVVGNIGFIAQNVISERLLVSPTAPLEYRHLTEGAGRLSLDFRFLSGRTDLDNKALMDIDRVVSFLGDSGYSGSNVLLLGFSDSAGDRRANIALSHDRANIVAKEFTQRGLKPATVQGFGPDLPVASNNTEAGKERNRRVEIWLKK